MRMIHTFPCKAKIIPLSNPGAYSWTNSRNGWTFQFLNTAMYKAIGFSI